MAVKVVKIEGLKEFERRLKRLGAKEAKKIVRASNHRAMLATVKAAKELVPVESGALKRSLTRRTKTYTNSGVVWTGVGADKRVVATNPATGEVRKPFKYLHLVEFGTRRVPARAFLRRAHIMTGPKVLTQHKRILGDKLTKAAKS